MTQSLPPLAIVAALAATLASPATAQDDGGFYVKAFGGLSTLSDADLTLGGTTGTQFFDSGAIAGGAIGYDYGDSPWRSEVEFTYRTGDPDGIDGDYASTALMVNGYYRFETGGRITPYVGAGLGVVTEIDFDVTGGANSGEYNDRGLLAGQAMVGADVALSGGWSLFAEVRYFRTETPTLTRDDGAKLSADYESVDAMVGLTWQF